MARRCTAKEWLVIRENLMAIAPLPRHYKVEIFRNPIEHVHAVGLTELIDWEAGKFRIQVEANLTVLETEDVLIHELAHVIDWGHKSPASLDHGPTFWIRFGELWTAYHQVK